MTRDLFAGRRPHAESLSLSSTTLQPFSARGTAPTSGYSRHQLAHSETAWLSGCSGKSHTVSVACVPQRGQVTGGSSAPPRQQQVVRLDSPVVSIAGVKRLA